MLEEKQLTDQLSGLIFNIQRYSIHDGPGIRTTVFLKGCPLRCFWCQNPESQSTRTEIMLDKSICTRCGACISICRSEANVLREKSVLINRDKCTGCGACVERCLPAARKLEGTAITPEEVMAVVMKDKAMYKTSGGGITLSGGDPVMQPQFSLALLKKSKENGLHTAMETCGYTKWENLENLLKYTDYLFYDIKTIDREHHKTGTGCDNQLILENAIKAVAVVRDMHVRCPMIPGFNDTEESVASIAKFVSKELRLPAERFTLLRYNKYAEGKYERLDRENEMPLLEPQATEYMVGLESIIRSIIN